MLGEPDITRRRAPQRLSISLDDESVKLIEKFQLKFKTSKADVIRRALRCYNEIEEAGGPPLDYIRAYIDFLAKGEHVIVDVDHWRTIFNEIGEGSKKFWDEVHRIGDNHRAEYCDKGLRSVREILDYVEKANWYKLSADSEHGYTLVLNVPESKKFVKTFFEGLFSAYPQIIEITEGFGKIRINVVT